MDKNLKKKEIRKQVFAARKAQTPEEIVANSKAICNTIMEMPAYREASCIYVYMDYNGEVSTRMLIEDAWKHGKRVAAPKVFGKEMKYFYITSYDDLEEGYFHIPEPVTTEEAHDEEALLIVPGVGFDKNRHRCGYGGGFYDRYLSEHTLHTTVAVAFDFQIVEDVPADTHDILPQVVVTQSVVYREA